MQEHADRIHRNLHHAIAVCISLWAGCSSAPQVASDARVELAPDAEQAQAIALQGDEAYEAADYSTCAELYGRAAGLRSGQQAGDYHDTAVCLIMAGHVEPALASLEQSAALGYYKLDQLQQESVWKPLHGDPRWQRVLAQVQEAHDEWLASIHRDVHAMFQQDQAARVGKSFTEIDWERVSRADAEHRERVRQLMQNQQLKSSADYYHAAMIFQHGKTPSDFETAHELALTAVRLNPTDRAAKWLAAATKDRALMNRGEPQRYGTQFKMVDGRWILYPVDPNVTDRERAQWNVPSLASAQKRAKAMNIDATDEAQKATPDPAQDP